jgi:hypothetical protein
MDDDIKLKIISAAYGNCSIKDKISVRHLIRSDKEYKKLFDEYRKTARSVHRLHPDICPADIADDAFTRINKGRSDGSTLLFLFSRPVLVSAISVIMLAAVIITFRATRVEKKQEYTRQEVVEAEKQVKESLAIVSRALNKTSKKIGEDILPNKVGKPIRQGIDIINQLFPKGDKNDENS